MTGFWMYEEGGELQVAVVAYLRGDPLSREDIALIRDYCRQWIDAPGWALSREIEKLREGVDGLTSRAALNAWFGKAVEAGIDPL